MRWPVMPVAEARSQRPGGLLAPDAESVRLTPVILSLGRPREQGRLRAFPKDSVGRQGNPGQIGPVRRSVRHDQPPMRYSAKGDAMQICVPWLCVFIWCV